MVKHALLIACTSAAVLASAQDSTTYRGTGLLRASAAISPGFLLGRAAANNYVNGRLEYFTDQRVSFRGEGFLFISAQQQPAFLKQNSQLAFGPFYHFGQGRLDAMLGIEPGLSFAQPQRPVTAVEYEELRVLPNLALCTGITYTVWDCFHFFLDARLNHARYTGSLNGTIALDELIISGGLGWQLRVKK